MQVLFEVLSCTQSLLRAETEAGPESMIFQFFNRVASLEPLVRLSLHCSVLRLSCCLQGWKKGLIFLQMRFTTGWGIARVAVGMAFGDLVYSKSKGFFT